MVQCLENEIWIPISGYENLYEVSNLGRVKSLTKFKKCKFKIAVFSEIILKGSKNYRGAHRVGLVKDGKPLTFMVHRLVALSFLPNPENKPQINHKNGNPSDNNINNLEWATASENTKHSYDVLKRKPSVQLKGELSPNYKKGHLREKCRNIICQTLDIEFRSIREAARDLGLSPGNIWGVLNNRYAHTNGFSFIYKN